MKPIAEMIPTLVGEFQSWGALGVILVDASALETIEQTYGARPFRACLESIERCVFDRVAKELGEEAEMVVASLNDVQLVFCFPRERSDSFFLTQTLPLLADGLNAVLAHGVGRFVYPYITDSIEIPVGQAFGLYRPFLRQEVQIGRLLDAAREDARFNTQHQRRKRTRTLQRALLREELSARYEPIVELESGQRIGLEALARGPEGSELETPKVLFEIAQSCDLSFELDALCRQLAMRDTPELGPSEKLFLNVLPTSLRDSDLDAGGIGRLGWAPSDLVLEVSERVAIANYPIFREAIDHFSKLGFGIALDDVGAGYNSLKAALELNPDFLKLDMSIVRGIDEDPHKRELVKGLRRLADSMNSRIIAEGIETESERTTLRDLGIYAGQGFLFPPYSAG